jgi:hypothetical protein
VTQLFDLNARIQQFFMKNIPQAYLVVAMFVNGSGQNEQSL